MQNGRSDGKLASVNGTMRMRTAKQLIGTFDTTCPVRVSDVDAQLAIKVPVERRRQISEPLFSDGVNNRTQKEAAGDQTGADLRLADDSVEIERCETFNDDDEMKICQFTRTDPLRMALKNPGLLGHARPIRIFKPPATPCSQYG